MCYERNDTRRQLVVSLIVCLTLVVVLILCNLFFSSKKTEHFICYFLARLLLTPVTFVSLGYCLSKVVRHLWGTSPKISELVSQYSKILTLALLSVNVIIIAPYIFWYMKAVVRALSGNEVAMTFPHIWLYSDVAKFFLDVMYKAAAIYIVPGFVLGIFPFTKRNDSRDLPGD